MSSVARTITTAEELLAASPRLGRCELVRGELRMMAPAGGDHGDVTGTLHSYLGHYVVRNRLGKIYTAETGFVLERNPDSVRAPDIAFIAAARAPRARGKGFIPIAPDLVVETLSPDDRASAVAAKVQWWLDHGVREVWVVDGDNQTVTLHRPGGEARTLGLDDTLEGGQIVPGFTVPLRELFA